MSKEKTPRLLLPSPFGEFYRSMGISRSTAYRYRKNGWIKTLQISGRLFVSPDEVGEFTRRAEQGHFAVGELRNPQMGKSSIAEGGL